jgi:HCOMODA/2-hydroxy-3-carboxy-muconic semialdehyde decarboxylase
MDDTHQAIRDLVIANRVLAKEGVLDAYGHVSIRHPSRPDRFLLSRSLSPELVTADDIIEFTLDGRAVGDDRPPYLERYIHAGIYEARPEVNSVVHSHAEDVLPFAISRTTPLRAVFHSASDMGHHVPVWDIADNFGGETDLLVTNAEQGRDLAKRLDENSVVLMRGHGFAAAAASVLMAVRLCVYLPRNARVLMAAMRMGDFSPLREGEINTRLNFDPKSPAMRRGWEYWATRAGCADLLD